MQNIARTYDNKRRKAIAFFSILGVSVVLFIVATCVRLCAKDAAKFSDFSDVKNYKLEFDVDGIPRGFLQAVDSGEYVKYDNILRSVETVSVTKQTVKYFVPDYAKYDDLDISFVCDETLPSDTAVMETYVCNQVSGLDMEYYKDKYIIDYYESEGRDYASVRPFHIRGTDYDRSDMVSLGSSEEAMQRSYGYFIFRYPKNVEIVIEEAPSRF